MRRILIAEDEPRIASFLEKGLQANGFTTTVVEDGRDALDGGASTPASSDTGAVLARSARSRASSAARNSAIWTF